MINQAKKSVVSKLDSNKKHVMSWIDSNFDVRAFNVQDFPALPGGVLLTDSSGDSVLVWWDILFQRVKFEVRRKGGC